MGRRHDPSNLLDPPRNRSVALRPDDVARLAALAQSFDLPPHWTAIPRSLSAGTLLLVAAPQPLTPPATSIPLRIRLSSAAFRVLTHLAVQHAAHNRFQRPSISILLHAIAQGTLPLVRP